MSFTPTIGQRWASLDPRDMRNGHNQRRELVGLDSRYAYFARTGGGKPHRVALTRDGIGRHRLVELP